MRETEYVDGVLQRHQDRTTNVHDDLDSEKKMSVNQKVAEGLTQVLFAINAVVRIALFLEGHIQRRI